MFTYGNRLLKKVKGLRSKRDGITALPERESPSSLGMG